jgi:DNA-binding transcriptional ArsR family regulator
MPTAFEVIAEPHRRRILDLLLEHPRPAGELTSLLRLTQPGTSRHLRVLREAGLVRVRHDAQRRWYELRPAGLAEIDAWLQPYRRLWAGRLDELERHIGKPARGTVRGTAGSPAKGRAGSPAMGTAGSPAKGTAKGKSRS